MSADRKLAVDGKLGSKVKLEHQSPALRGLCTGMSFVYWYPPKAIGVIKKLSHQYLVSHCSFLYDILVIILLVKFLGYLID